MPNTVTFNVNVTVDKGPTVKGEAKLDTGLYSATVEEAICRGAEHAVDIDVNLKSVDMLVITSDKFKNDKEPCSVPGQSTDKTLKFRIEGPEQCGGKPLFVSMANCCNDKKTDGAKQGEATKVEWCDLTRPFIISGPSVCSLPDFQIKSVRFKNDLAQDVKVSVLVVRPCAKDCKCA